jgi:hypothetical protein
LRVQKLILIAVLLLLLLLAAVRPVQAALLLEIRIAEQRCGVAQPQ